jgi:large subunit ribosomal protein L4
MVAKVYGIDGKERREITLAEEVFNARVSTGSIYHAIRNELANRRVGTASTKTRSEVTGSGTKPWRQKGTGRARAGSRQSPVWVGGGVVFGPKPRDYSYRLPRKIKRLAMRSILSQKLKENRLRVVEDFSIDSGKTRELVKVLRALAEASGDGGAAGARTGALMRTTLIVTDDEALLRRAGRNIPGLSILSFNRLKAHDMFYSASVLVLEKAALQLNDFYAEAGRK